MTVERSDYKLVRTTGCNHCQWMPPDQTRLVAGYNEWHGPVVTIKVVGLTSDTKLFCHFMSPLPHPRGGVYYGANMSFGYATRANVNAEYRAIRIGSIYRVRTVYLGPNCGVDGPYELVEE